jgi:hypothetical protein
MRTDLGWVPRAPGVGDTDRFRREGTGDDDDEVAAPLELLWWLPFLVGGVLAGAAGTAATEASNPSLP